MGKHAGGTARKKLPSFLIAASLVICSTAASLLFFEAVLRLRGQRPLHVNPEQLHFWKHDALLGWAHRPGQEGMFEMPLFRHHVRINSRGLRDAEHAERRGAAAGKRILALGDSYAWGFGVEEESRFSERLETSMGIDVINAGVSGYSTDQELLWLRETGVRYEVDLVLLLFCGNDAWMNRLDRVYHVYHKPRYALRDGDLILEGVPVPEPSRGARLLHWLRRHLALPGFVERRLSGAQAPGIPGIDETDTSSDPFGLTLALLDEMRRITDSMGVPLVIVAWEAGWDPSRGVYRDFVAALRERNFILIENVEAMQGFRRDAMTLPGDLHWNAEGHRFVAERIRDLIEDRRLLAPEEATGADGGNTSGSRRSPQAAPGSR